MSRRVSTFEESRRKTAQRELERQLDRQAEAERSERDEAIRRRLAEREKRDAEIRALASKANAWLARARRTAEDAQTDFEMGCERMALGQLGEDEIERLQDERDRTRRALERAELATRSLAGDSAIVGYR